MTYFPTLAFCTPEQRWAVLHAAGVEPLTCPPYLYARASDPPSPQPAKHFDPGLLRNRRLLYFSLHGIPHQPYWYGQDNITAMSVDAFQGLDLSETIVFAANCHLPETPFLPAILACKPLLLVGGQGVNLTRGHSLIGAHLLGYLFRLALEVPIRPAYALAMAKYTLTLRTDALQQEADQLKNRLRKQRILDDITANQDALAFQSFT